MTAAGAPPWTRDRSRVVMDRLLDNGLSARATDAGSVVDVDFDQAHAILDEEMAGAHAVRATEAEPGNGTEILVRSPALTKFLADVEREVQGAQRKFPGNLDKIAATAEEFGELAQAMLHHKRGIGPAADVYAEAVQLAGMACQLALGGDSAFPYRFDIAHHHAFVATGSKPEATA